MIPFDTDDELASLPRLAWGLEITPTSMKLVRGLGVESTGSAVYEGAWSGGEDDIETFAEPGRLRVGELGGQYFFGSAALRTEPSKVLLIPPTHTLDGLYVEAANDGSGLFVTNSFAWAMKRAGGTAPRFARDLKSVQASLMTATQGIAGFKRLVFAPHHHGVLQLIHTPVVINTATMQIEEQPVPLPPRGVTFTYEAYRAALHNVIAQAVTNSRSPRRRAPFGDLISTMSSGYDSPACAALGKDLGLKKAVTVRNGRGARNDSGEDAARGLGVTITAFDRPGDGLEHQSPVNKDWYLKVDSLREAGGKSYAEFLCTLSNLGDVYFDPFENEVTNSTLMTGFHGAIWFYNTHCSPWIRRNDTSGSGLNEFRLRVGFVHMPVPYILARYAMAIERLSQSAEMRPFSYGNPNNKPIPRRITEEAGAARESFGGMKMAANVMVQASEQTLSEALAEVADRYV